MTKLKLSNSQRDLYLQCGKKYYYRYIKKMRPRAKGSALFFGGAFDHACETLLEHRDLPAAKIAFTERWMNQEGNSNCKFAKTDYVEKILEASDVAKITACIDNLNHSKAKEEYAKHCDTLKLVSDIKKLGESSFSRELTREESQFLHFATLLSMNRKGLLMLESFYTNILPHLTQVVGTQVKIDIQHPDGHSITGFIDLVAKMTGYKLDNGRVLSDDDIIVLDVKSAGAAYWAKLDDLTMSDQLDSYLISPEVQAIKPTNLIGYLAVSKQISTHEESICKSCGNKKNSSHKTCNADIDGKRCNGEWDMRQTFFCDAKMVIGERDLAQASVMLEDYTGVLNGVLSEVFVRNRNSCNAYGSYCEYMDICGKGCGKDVEEAKIADWISSKGE